MRIAALLALALLIPGALLAQEHEPTSPPVAQVAPVAPRLVGVEPATEEGKACLRTLQQWAGAATLAGRLCRSIPFVSSCE